MNPATCGSNQYLDFCRELNKEEPDDPYHNQSVRCADRGCMEVCPVDCIVPGLPVGEWPWMYTDHGYLHRRLCRHPEAPTPAGNTSPRTKFPRLCAEGGEHISRSGLTVDYEGQITMAGRKLLEGSQVVDSRGDRQPGRTYPGQP